MKFQNASVMLAVLLLAACGSDTSAGGGSDAGGNDAGQNDAETDTGVTDGSGGGCVDLDDDGFGPGCAAGVDCLPNDPTGFTGAPERCGDGIDNDCDGIPDDDCSCVDGAFRQCYDGPAATQDVGICRGGFQQCTGGAWGECEGDSVPRDGETSCDGRDEDCNGVIDDGLLNACGTCGAVPLEACGDRGWGNGLDDDCDGTIDEADACGVCDGRTRQPCYASAPTTLGVGECRGGLFDCVDGGWTECVGEQGPTEEACDGLDNDCDGVVDEGMRNSCGDCGAEDPVELCDNVDNDCDGVIDEGVRLACGLCPSQVVDEVCGDGLDNDCDNTVDEGCPCDSGDEVCYPGPESAAGIGACRAGVRECSASGEFWGECTGYVLPTLEVCDGLDNDCDGGIDVNADGCSVCGVESETCDGIDNDCDGFVDEALRNPCGTCLEEVVAEELGSDAALCDGIDNDCDGQIDERLVNACGACDEPCYVEQYNTPEQWSEGEFDGVDPENLDSGMRLGRQRFNFPDLWVANASDATVTRINTDTSTVVGTFPVGASPSRTAIDFDGNAWIANRAFGGQGSVTKIRAEGCTGDACVAFTTLIGGNDAVPRGLAIDAEGFAWVGTFNDHRLWRIHPDTGAIVEQYDVGIQIYGLAIDREGIIWISSISSAGIAAFDTTTRTVLGPYTVPGVCTSPYGIAVDGDGNVWFGNWTCNSLVKMNRASFDAGGPVTFSNYTHASLQHVRGVAVDGDGYIYVAASNSNRLLKFDPRTETFVWTAATCSTPIGVGIARDGAIWTMCYGSNQAQRFSADGALLNTVAVGRNPYSYSDMTGFQLRNFTAPRGFWRTVFDCGFTECKFDQVVLDASIPPGTDVEVRARTSADMVTWSEWTDYIADNPAEIGTLPRGRYCQVEVALGTTEDEITPVVTDVQILWQRP